MKIVVFGLGYVGFTTACCMANDGHRVVGIDVSSKKVESINAGNPPIVEHGLTEMLGAAQQEDRLVAQTGIDGALDGAQVALVCVGTPSATDGSLNLSFIVDVSRQIAAALKSGPNAERLTVAYRSTMPPGTMDAVVRPLFEVELGAQADRLVELIYYPEFLREGTAVADYYSPPKHVFGSADGLPSSRMIELSGKIEAPTFWVRYPEAEITKFVDNTWHALKVAFANEIGRACLELGVSAKAVHEIFKSDRKLNLSAYYLRPGGAFGGSCLPKDVRALQKLGADHGANLHVIDSLLRSNESHKHRLFQLAIEGLKPGARILLAGLSFKAGTDDLRESPNVDLARKLLEWGADLAIFDPAIEAEKLVGANLGYAFSNLPMIERLLIDKDTAESGSYARVIAANSTVDMLSLPADVDILEVHTLA